MGHGPHRPIRLRRDDGGGSVVRAGMRYLTIVTVALEESCS
jgi:hypothetical protein